MSILVATHNRPVLLREALASVASQSCPDWEVIVVDDGSTAPVRAASLGSVLGDRFKLIRHASARGIAAAKNAGLDSARGEVIVHLDDDDLLESSAVESIVAAFSRHPELECLFVNVEAFGPNAEYANESQKRALRRVVAAANPRQEGQVLHFGRDLVLGLLQSVPWAFQRPAATQRTWRAMGGFPEDVSLPEAEWALYAAATRRTALLADPMYRVRAAGQGYASRASNWISHLDSAIESRRRFRRFADELPDSAQNRRLRKAATRALAGSLVDKAYYCTREEIVPDAARKAALASLAVRPSTAAAKLFVKSVLLSLA